MSEGEVPLGPLRAAVKAVTAPFRAWASGDDDVPAGFGRSPVGYDAKGRALYAPLSPGGARFWFESLDDWRSRL